MAKVLCIEDERDLREDFVEVLREGGYEVFEASNGEDGLRILDQARPDLVLCDITMPKMNGYQVLEAVRKDYPELADIPFIFLTALADREDVIAGKKLGADDYLTKPVDFSQLLATIEARLGQIERINRVKERDIYEIRKEIMLLLPHELLTPLNHIIGFSEMLGSECFGPIGDERYIDYIKKIQEAGNHLNDTVMNVLTLADVITNRAKPDVGACNVEQCIDGILECQSKQATLSGVEFVCDVSAGIPLVTGDFDYICQTLSALSSNAIKFSSGAGRVELKAEKSSKHGWIQIEIHDQGVGMSPTDLAEAVKPFSQLDRGMNRHFDGVGIGLALSKALMESMGGKLFVSSAPDAGTTATIMLREWQGDGLGGPVPAVSEQSCPFS